MKIKTLTLSLLTSLAVPAFELPAEPLAAGVTNRFAVTGMTCEGCANGLASELRRVKGVSTASVSLTNQTATVVFNTNQVDAARLIEAVREAGYGARVIKP